MVLGRAGLGLLVAAGVTLGVYGPVQHDGFVYEDMPVMAPVSWSWHVPLPRELTDLSMRSQIEQGPGAMHLGNVAVHLMNGLLMAALVWPVSGPVAVLAASAWWLAPIQTESVVYLSGRADLLVVSFTLLALLVGRWSLSAALLCCLLAVWSKETGVMSLGLLALYRWSKGWSWLTPSLILLGVGVLVGWRLLPRLYTWADPSVESPLWYAAIQLTAVLRLLALVVWPFGLTVDHDWDAIGHTVSAIAVFMSAIAIARFWSVRAVRFAAVWIVLALLPRFLVPTADWIAERHLPLALIGPWLALAKGL